MIFNSYGSFHGYISYIPLYSHYLRLNHRYLMKKAIKFHSYVTRGYPCLPGYPTLVLVAGGKRYDFRGGRMRHLGGAMVGAMVIL